VRLSDAGAYACTSASGEWRNVTVKVQNALKNHPEAMALQQDETDRFEEVPQLDGELSENFFLTPGQNFEVSCPPTGGYPIPRITWLKDKRVDKELRTSQDQWTLNIPTVTLEDQGRYTCELTNRVGTVLRHFDLFVSGNFSIKFNVTIIINLFMILISI